MLHRTCARLFESFYTRRGIYDEQRYCPPFVSATGTVLPGLAELFVCVAIVPPLLRSPVGSRAPADVAGSLQCEPCPRRAVRVLIETDFRFRSDIHARSPVEGTAEIRVQLAQDRGRVQVRREEKRLAADHHRRRVFDHIGNVYNRNRNR